MQYCINLIQKNVAQLGKNCFFLAFMAMYLNMEDIRTLKVIRWGMAKKKLRNTVLDYCSKFDYDCNQIIHANKMLMICDWVLVLLTV